MKDIGKYIPEDGGETPFLIKGDFAREVFQEFRTRAIRDFGDHSVLGVPEFYNGWMVPWWTTRKNGGIFVYPEEETSLLGNVGPLNARNSHAHILLNEILREVGLRTVDASQAEYVYDKGIIYPGSEIAFGIVLNGQEGKSPILSQKEIEENRKNRTNYTQILAQHLTNQLGGPVEENRLIPFHALKLKRDNDCGIFMDLIDDKDVQNFLPYKDSEATFLKQAVDPISGKIRWVDWGEDYYKNQMNNPKDDRRSLYIRRNKGPLLLFHKQDRVHYNVGHHTGESRYNVVAMKDDSLRKRDKELCDLLQLENEEVKAITISREGKDQVPSYYASMKDGSSKEFVPETTYVERVK